MYEIMQKGLAVVALLLMGLAAFMLGLLLVIPAGALVLAFIIVRSTNDKARTELTVRYDRRQVSQRGMWKIY